VQLQKNLVLENWFCFRYHEKLLRWIHSIDLICTSGQISLVKVYYFRNFNKFNVNVQFFSIAFFLSSITHHSFVGSSTFFLCYEFHANCSPLVQRLSRNFKYEATSGNYLFTTDTK